MTGPGGHLLPAATLQLKTGENKTALEISRVPLPAHLTAKALILGVSDHVSWQEACCKCVRGWGSKCPQSPIQCKRSCVLDQRERKAEGGWACGQPFPEGHAKDTCGLFYPQCRPCGWCLDSEHTGTPPAPEGRKRKLSQRLQGPTLGSNCSTP